jgi:hypothetical protein
MRPFLVERLGGRNCYSRGSPHCSESSLSWPTGGAVIKPRVRFLPWTGTASKCLSHSVTASLVADTAPQCIVTPVMGAQGGSCGNSPGRGIICGSRKRHPNPDKKSLVEAKSSMVTPSATLLFDPAAHHGDAALLGHTRTRCVLRVVKALHGLVSVTLLIRAPVLIYDVELCRPPSILS